MKKIILYTVLISFISTLYFSGCGEDAVVTNTSAFQGPLASEFDGASAMAWMDLLCRLIARESRHNPPKASRIYCYAGITMYESVVNGIPTNRSLSGQLTDMPAMPVQTQEYDWPSVVAGSMPVVIKALMESHYPSTLNSLDDLHNRQVAERKSVVDSNLVNRSVSYGVSIANKILAWAETDNYRQTRGLIYIPPPRSENPAYWEPINPGDTVEEPFWGRLRPFAMPTQNYCDLPPSYPFDTTPGSQFYNDEYEIWQIRSSMTQEHKDIALFWRDKQLTPTPPGHWVSIASQMVSKFSMKLDKTAEMFAYVGIAVGDAFISAWEAKYKYNYLRPQSYIDDYIEPGWLPFLPTPPFPDYPSGHSTESGAASYVLTHLLGIVAFTDTTHNSRGYPPRSFNSFYDAAVECSNSRVYGGIHYKDACENGVARGQLIGQTIINRIRFKKFY